MMGEHATLEELLRDPIIRLVMASDGVHADEISRLFRQMRTRNFRRVGLANGPSEAAAGHRRSN